MDMEIIAMFTERIVGNEIRSRTLFRHYVKTMSELTGKSENVIKKELRILEKEVKKDIEQELIDKSKE